MTDTSHTRDTVHRLAKGWLQAIAQKLAKKIDEGGVDSLKPADLQTLLHVLEATAEQPAEVEQQVAPSLSAGTPSDPSGPLNPIRAWMALAPQLNTLTRLARMTKIDRARLSRYLNGRVAPSTDTKRALEKATKGDIPQEAWTTSAAAPVPDALLLVVEEGPVPKEHRWGDALQKDLAPAESIQQQHDLLTAVEQWYLLQHERRVRSVEELRRLRRQCAKRAQEAHDAGDVQAATYWQLRANELQPREPDHATFVTTIRGLVDQQRRLAEGIETLRPQGVDEVRVRLDAVDAEDDDADAETGPRTDHWSDEREGPTTLHFPVPEEFSTGAEQ